MSLPEPPVVQKIRDYRARSQESSERAMQTGDPDVRQSWDVIARGYHDMAERLERGAAGPRIDLPLDRAVMEGGVNLSRPMSFDDQA